MTSSNIRILLNGKKAGREDVRSAITSLRDQGHKIEVRSTWEQGDIERLVEEAANDSVCRLVAGGGDGTLNEVVDSILTNNLGRELDVAMLPLGTANDFATACQISSNPFEALQLAVTGSSFPVDVGCANDRHFVNVASGGFGAQVTAETPTQLKNFLGGGAYTLAGIAKALNFSPYPGKLVCKDINLDVHAIIGAVCNNRQAGGGQVLAAQACIDDGLLDVFVLVDFPIADLDIVIKEIRDPAMGSKYIKRFRTAELHASGEVSMPVNLDGEPYDAKQINFKILPGAVRMVLPDDCPCINPR
jgi:lipid kinase YegS